MDRDVIRKRVSYRPNQIYRIEKKEKYELYSVTLLQIKSRSNPSSIVDYNLVVLAQNLQQQEKKKKKERSTTYTL